MNEDELAESIETEQEGLAQDFIFLSPEEYFHDLKKQVLQSNKRAYLQTMSLEIDHFTLLVFELFKKKSAEGVDVQVSIDDFANMVTDGHMNALPILSKAKRVFSGFRTAQKKQQIAKLIESGVAVRITNPVKKYHERFFAAQGRSHVKLAVTDATAYLGGLNVSDAGFSRPDFMIRVTDPELVEQVAQLYRNPPAVDTAFSEVDHTQLLYDCGEKGKSLILDTAVQIIDHSQEEVWLTSQFYPDGKIIPALSKARKRGVKVRVLVADPNSVDEPHSHAFNRLSQFRYALNGESVPVELHPRWIHAKLLLIDPNTEAAVVLSGTHNLSQLGVSWGNAEASFISRDKDFLKSSTTMIENLFKHANPKT